MSATIRDAINYIDRLLIAPPGLIRGIDKQTNMLAQARSALVEKAERENPQPLTLEELRGMNGQPVWIAEENAWGIIGVDSCGIHEGRPFAKFRYDSIWCEYDIERRKLHCYRYKPEEEHNET